MKKITKAQQAKSAKLSKKRAAYTKKRDQAKKALVAEKHLANQIKNSQSK